jgi:hypothetical protein
MPLTKPKRIPIGNLSGRMDYGNIPAGMIIQTVQTVETAAFSAAPGAQWADFPGLSVSITPKFSTSKIMVIVDAKIAHTQDSTVVRGRLVRGSTAIYVGDASSNRPRGSSAQYYVSSGGNGKHFVGAAMVYYLDSPATTSSVTYKFQYGSDSNTHVVQGNRTQADRDNAYYDSRTASSITVQEIAQ